MWWWRENGMRVKSIRVIRRWWGIRSVPGKPDKKQQAADQSEQESRMKEEEELNRYARGHAMAQSQQTCQISAVIARTARNKHACDRTTTISPMKILHFSETTVPSSCVRAQGAPTYLKNQRKQQRVPQKRNHQSAKAVKVE